MDETLYIYEGEPDAGHARRRIVQMKDLRPLAKKQKGADIPELYRSALLTTWRDELSNPGARELVGEYLSAPTQSLYVYGSVGTGKTWLVCCIANQLLDRGRTVIFQSFPQLLIDLRNTFVSENISEGGILAPLFERDFLVLDELGDVGFNGDPRASHFTASRILLLLEQRSQSGKHTLMTSNLSLAQLVEWCGDERVGSRIRGICGENGIVELSGRDLRFDPEREAAQRNPKLDLVPG